MTDSITYDAAYLHSPIGILKILGNERAVASIQFVEKIDTTPSLKLGKAVVDCTQQLEEYFNRSRQSFDISLDFQGTPFQQKVWEFLKGIDFGKTASYKDIAVKMDNLGAIRAIGRANGANPFAIVIPCHRIIGSDGSLTGYAGELWRKKWLLDFEQQYKQLSLFD